MKRFHFCLNVHNDASSCTTVLDFESWGYGQVCGSVWRFRGQVISPRGGSVPFAGTPLVAACVALFVALDTLRLTPTITPLSFLFSIPTPARSKNELT